MAPLEKKEKEKLPVNPDLDEIQARIDLALAKRDALVNCWVKNYDTSRCTKDMNADEIRMWDEELYNPKPAHLGLGAAVPKEYLDGDGNRQAHAGNNRLRNLMLGGQNATKKRDQKEKEESKKRAKTEASDDEDEGRASMVKSKKAKKIKPEKEAEDKPVEKVNKALLAMMQETKEEESEDTRGDDNPWKSTPRPLSSVLKNKKKKKKDKKKLEDATVTGDIPAEPKAAEAKPETSTLSTTVNEPDTKMEDAPAKSPSPPVAPLNAAIALSNLRLASSSVSSSISDSCDASVASSSPAPDPDNLTPEQRQKREANRRKKQKEKEKKKAKKAALAAAAAAEAGAGMDAEMADVAP